MIEGSPILAVLPVLAFLLFYCYLLGGQGRPGEGFRRPFVLAAIGWGAYLAISSEVLSLFGGLSPLWVAMIWLIPCIALGEAARRSDSIRHVWMTLADGLGKLSRAEKLILGGIAAVCATLFAVAVISPPNTYDSALYHLSRVVHWAQNASLKPYPALFEHQLHKPIWAETAILHLRTLWGSDRPAGLVQWFSMVGSLVVVSGIAGLLKGGRGAQILSAAFCISIPMGVLQASSTQNDYVAAFWAVCLAYLVVLSVRRQLTTWELAALAAATGLGALTKGTFYVYAPPFLAWFFAHELVARGWGRAIRGAAVIALVAVLLNAGFWARNIQVYGGPYGRSQWLQQNLWVRLLEEPSDSVPEDLSSLPAGGGNGAVAGEPAESLAPTKVAEQSAPLFAPVQDYLVRLIQTAGRNLTVPTGFLTRPLIAALADVPGVFGESYAREMRSVSWNHEDSAGSPLHLIFVLVAGVALLVIPRRPDRKLELGYAGVVFWTYAMIPVVIGHGPGIVGIRYQLSFFVLSAPIVGVAFAIRGRDRWWQLLAAGFLLASIPWLLFNRTRPLFGLPPQRTWIGSILVEPQEAILIPWNPALRDDYILAAEAVAASGCTLVELRANAAFLEYPLWWLLNAPQSGIRIESLEVNPYLKRYIDPDFEPCAVICANCDVQQSAHGLPLFGTYDSMKVYLQD
jgi:hypothetical protein